MEIEKLSQRFMYLAGKQLLNKSEHAEAKALMCQLKTAGMSNEEISKLSKGTWSESTVKGYVKGIKSGDPVPWHDSITIFEELVSSGMTINDVAQTTNSVKKMAAYQMSLDDLVCSIDTIENAGIALTDFVSYVSELKKSEVPPSAVEELISTKNELASCGFTLTTLKEIAKTVKTYGDPEQVIKAVSTFGSIGEIENKTSLAQQQHDGMKSSIDEAAAKLEHIEDKIKAQESRIARCDFVFALGFTEESVGNLIRVTRKFGGPADILDLLEESVTIIELHKTKKQKEQELAELQKESTQMESKVIHYKTSLALIDKLVTEYNIGIDGIEIILSLAGKHGKPADIMKALERYSSIEELDENINKLQGIVEQRKQEAQVLEGKITEELNQINRLHSDALETGREVGRIEGRWEKENSIQRLINIMGNPSSVSYEDGLETLFLICNAAMVFARHNQKRMVYATNVITSLRSILENLAMG